MAGGKDFLRDAIQSYLETKLEEIARRQVPVPDNPERKLCPSGYIEGLIKIDGQITFGGDLIQPEFTKSAKYLGDGAFDLRLDLRVDSACSTLWAVTQGVVDISTVSLEWEVNLGPANIVKVKVKVKIGPLSFHFRLYECPKEIAAAPASPLKGMTVSVAGEEAIVAVVPVGSLARLLERRFPGEGFVFS